MLTPWGKLGKAFECPGDPRLVWAITFPKGCRNNNTQINFGAAAAYIVTDAVIYLLPFRSLLSLPLNTKDRSKVSRNPLLGFCSWTKRWDFEY